MANIAWTGGQADKLYLQSGEITSTIKDSEAVTTIDTSPADISFDGANSPWIGDQANKFYLQSGQFTSTILTSQLVGTIGRQFCCKSFWYFLGF